MAAVASVVVGDSSSSSTAAPSMVNPCCVDMDLHTTNEYEAEERSKSVLVGGEVGEFDETIGHLQAILLEEEFSELQQTFLQDHCHHFEDSEENKFIYTDIFKQYTELVEGYLERELQARIPTFNMHTFLQSLQTHRDDVVEELMDLLLSFTDFLAFKQLMLDTKAKKEGRGLDLGGLVVTPLSPCRK